MLKFTYGGIDSSTLGIYFASEPEFSAPEPVYVESKVAGRNGVLSSWDGSYNNITATFQCFCLADDITAVRSALAAIELSPGYKDLIVSDDSGAFRKARLTSGIQTKYKNGIYNAFDLVFDCMPQRFLTSGTTAVTKTSGATITNPTSFVSRPYIVVYGSGSNGTISIGGNTITLSTVTNGMKLDCETMDAWSGTSTNRNSAVSGSFPQLISGNNTIELSDNITSIKITPRWWTL